MTRSVFGCLVNQSAGTGAHLPTGYGKGFFSVWMEKGNVVPIHKKDDKQCLKHYRPISLLPICVKKFEKLLFNEMFKFFIENEFIFPNQLGFKLGLKSCINQLLAILLTKYINHFMMDLLTIIVSSENRVTSMQCLFHYYWSDTRFIKGETIPSIRFWILTTTSLA